MKVFFKAFVFWLRSEIVHVHMSSNLKIFVILVSRIFMKRVIYTHHNSIVKSKPLFRLVCKLCNAIILVNSRKVIESVKSEVDRAKIYQIPAFIPPMDSNRLPERLVYEISKYELVYSTNCYSSDRINGEEIYGISRMLSVFCSLVNKGYLKNSILLICDPSFSYEDKHDWDRLKSLDGGNSIFYWGGPVDFSEVIKYSSCTVRPTITDGDSISVRESIYFQVPVIASDCVDRPDGTILYKTLDDDSLAGRLLSFRSEANTKLSRQPDYAAQIIDVYNRMIGC